MRSKIVSNHRPRHRPRATRHELLAQMNLVREIASLGHGERKAAGIPVRQPLSRIKVVSSLDRIGSEFEKLLLDEVNVKKIEWQQLAGGRRQVAGGNDEGKDVTRVELDTTITEELKREGEARRIVRLIQKMRREAGVGLTEKIEVGLASWPEEFEEMIKRETLTEKLVKTEATRMMRIKHANIANESRE